MTSNDNFVTVEMFNSGIQDIKQSIDGLKTEIREVKYQEQLTTARIEWLQHSVYWGFAIIALVVALVPSLRKEKSEKKHEIDEQKVQEMIDISISKAFAGMGK